MSLPFIIPFHPSIKKRNFILQIKSMYKVRRCLWLTLNNIKHFFFDCSLESLCNNCAFCFLFFYFFHPFTYLKMMIYINIKQITTFQRNSEPPGPLQKIWFCKMRCSRNYFLLDTVLSPWIIHFLLSWLSQKTHFFLHIIFFL